MHEKEMNTVYNAFIILLEGDKEVLGSMDLISTDNIESWCSAKIDEVPYHIRSEISFDLRGKDEYKSFLKSIVEEEEVTRDVFRCVVATIYRKYFAGVAVTELNDHWVRLYAYLLNLSKELDEDSIDRELLECNYASELVAYFEDDFDVMSYERDHILSILSGLKYSLKIYQEFQINNWRYFKTMNQLVDQRIYTIRKVDKDGSVKYSSPEQNLFR